MSLPIQFRIKTRLVRVFLTAACFFAVVLYFISLSRANSAQAAPIVGQAPIQSVSTWPELDDIAQKLAAEITKNKLKSVFVIGAVGPKTDVTDLDVELRDALSDSLARHVQRTHVIDGPTLYDFLKNGRVSQAMLHSFILADWIAIYVPADGYVAIKVDSIKNGKLHLTAELHTKKKDFGSSKEFTDQITLTPLQVQTSDRLYHPPSRFPIEEAGKNGITQIACVYCPSPDYTDEARSKKVSAKLVVSLTVLPDGKADEILLRNPAGFGLDAEAVEKILHWKFTPAMKDGQPVAAHTEVEVYWQLH
jgi:TonB family protein